jgi:heme/copper-type cytochrome/quinol oxidase subunit 4
MKNSILDQQAKNSLIGKAVISFVLGVISGLVPIMMIFERFIPYEETLKLNQALEPYIKVLDRILYQFLPLGAFEFSLFIFVTSITGLILGIMVLRSKPRRRLITGLGIGGIFFVFNRINLDIIVVAISSFFSFGPVISVGAFWTRVGFQYSLEKSIKDIDFKKRKSILYMPE